MTNQKNVSRETFCKLYSIGLSHKRRKYKIFLRFEPQHLTQTNPRKISSFQIRDLFNSGLPREPQRLIQTKPRKGHLMQVPHVET